MGLEGSQMEMTVGRRHQPAITFCTQYTGSQSQAWQGPDVPVVTVNVSINGSFGCVYCQIMYIDSHMIKLDTILNNKLQFRAKLKFKLMEKLFLDS